MNCREGDLAYVTDMPYPVSEANGRFVQVKELVLAAGEAYWLLDKPVRFRARANFSLMGVCFFKGEPVAVDAIADAYLRPIRDPGDDAVDEMVRFFPAPKLETA
ncbi:hypothetical protein [Variovorax ginsengisoli]|uniref:Uncharacterized protein n=1 Tax=Variovorax ginsengisoli TaxID=363844 RepID=A0ABT8SDM7_9BURK|nr:hypothetical protein [Variovorax ginsengisoli]MDN8617846.1 hypothetical protein [Variovorax ginsengisoli]MDO1537016.1 hypothetical protein [Variovorax ginsengisoli]